MSNRASKAQFLEGFRRKTLEEVPGIDGDVIIQELSAADKTELSMRWAAMIGDDETPDSEDGEEAEASGIDIGVISVEFPFIIWKGMKAPKLTLKEVNKMPGSKADAFQFVGMEILKLSDLWAEEPDEDAEEVENPKADA